MTNAFKKITIMTGITSIALASIFSLTSCKNSDTEVVNAYDIAVANGYDGSESDWLASLKGTDGSDGEDAKTETAYSIYQSLLENTDYTGTYQEFLKEYMGENYSIDYYMNKSLMQSVEIVTTFTVTTTQTGFGPGRQQTTTQEQTYQGSGVFYSIDTTEGDAYIITAFHMIYESTSTSDNGICTNISCYLYGSDEAMSATYIGGDISNDIAILKIDDSDVLKDNTMVSEVTFGTYNNLYIGESIYAVGNNKGQGLSAAEGTLSLLSYNCSYEISDYDATVRSIRYDAANNSGNSGGGVYNEYGELIGIVDCKMEEEGIEGLQYAVPVSTVEPIAYHVVTNYEKTGSTSNEKVYLGIVSQDKNSTAYINPETNMYNTKSEVTVNTINSTSILNGSGIAVGDIITKLELNKGATTNNRVINVYHGYDISEFLYYAEKGDTLTITYESNGVEHTIDVTLTYTEAMPEGN